MFGKQSRNCEVDHLKGGVGFHDWETFVEWQKRILLVSFDDLRELCIECHKIINHQQKTGLSLEEARIDKTAIDLVKTKRDKVWLLEHGVKPASNATMRRQQIIDYLSM